MSKSPRIGAHLARYKHLRHASFRFWTDPSSYGRPPIWIDLCQPFRLEPTRQRTENHQPSSKRPDLILFHYWRSRSNDSHQTTPPPLHYWLSQKVKVQSVGRQLSLKTYQFATFHRTSTRCRVFWRRQSILAGHWTRNLQSKSHPAIAAYRIHIWRALNRHHRWIRLVRTTVCDSVVFSLCR